MPWYLWLILGTLVGSAAGFLLAAVLCAAGADAPKKPP